MARVTKEYRVILKLERRSIGQPNLVDPLLSSETIRTYVSKLFRDDGELEVLSVKVTEVGKGGEW